MSVPGTSAVANLLAPVNVTFDVSPKVDVPVAL